MAARAYQERLPKKVTAAAEFFFDLANERQVSYRCATTPPKVVTVCQDKDIEECTGGIVWETSFLLATFLEKQGLINKNDKVLEVGAGCGMLGLVLACHGCRVILSEASEAMANLKKNVMAVVAAHQHNLVAQARLLRWDNAEDIVGTVRSKDAPFDMILGTDVIFKPSLVEPLLKAISSMCHQGTVVYLCFQERCAESHRLLMTLAPTYFEVADASPALRETQGCHFARELECWLLRLTTCKKMLGDSSHDCGESTKCSDKDRDGEHGQHDVCGSVTKKRKRRGNVDSHRSNACSVRTDEGSGLTKKKKRKQKRQIIKQAGLTCSDSKNLGDIASTQREAFIGKAKVQPSLVDDDAQRVEKTKRRRRKKTRHMKALPIT